MNSIVERLRARSSYGKGLATRIVKQAQAVRAEEAKLSKLIAQAERHAPRPALLSRLFG
jgi:hypothetical protein